MGGNDHFPIRDRPMGVTNDKSAATPGPCFLAGSLGHQYDSGRASRVPVSLHAPEFLVHRWCFLGSSILAGRFSSRAIRTAPSLSDRLAVRVARSASGARKPRCVADLPACGDCHSDPIRLRVQLGGGLGGLHLMVIGALVPYLLLVGIPVLFLQSWKRFRMTPRQDA